jgi:uncharacterized membrane protein YgaE (UPF0421/DUF939 family)
VVSVPELPDRLRSGLRDPVRWTELIQLVKTAVAAVLAWVLASQVLGLPQAFLAPWAALLVVHATVYRTFSRGLRQVTAAVLGVVLAWMVGSALGLSTTSVSVLLGAGLLLGATRWFRDESTAVAATGLIVLTTGASGRDVVLVDRLLDTGIGIAVGLAVNLVVWPPLRDVAAARAIDIIDDRVGHLMCEMAQDLRGTADADAVTRWVDSTRDLDREIDQAWALLRQARESSRLNPRRAAVGLRRSAVFEEVLRDNEQAVAEVRSMARTLGHSIDGDLSWEPEFRLRWLELLTEAGEAILAPDSVRVTSVRAELNRLAEDLSTAELPTLHWPEYGALIMNLRNVVTSMDRVAEQNPVVVPRYENRRGRLLRGRPAGPSPAPPRRCR